MLKMRKFMMFLFAIGLLMGTSIPAFAAENIGRNESREIDVTAKYDSSTSTPNVYSVDIDWSSMTFTYTQSETKKWNASDHSYSTVSEGGWDKTSATVTVTNHSNVSVNVDLTYTAVAGTGVTGRLTNASDTLNAGEEGNYNGADSVTATLTISGTPTSTITSEGVKIGTIKVTIN